MQADCSKTVLLNYSIAKFMRYEYLCRGHTEKSLNFYRKTVRFNPRLLAFTMMKETISNLPPIVQSSFYKWAEFLHQNVVFNMPDSYFHGSLHCARVLLYALIMGERLFKEDTQALTILAHAAVFHDSRRQDEWADTGHGARAAAYYARFCQDAAHESTRLPYLPEAACLMQFHDLHDKVGKAYIRENFAAETDRVLLLYDIFKDADALDRLRFGELGLKPSYLRTSEAVSLIGFARELTSLSDSMEA